MSPANRDGEDDEHPKKTDVFALAAASFVHGGITEAWARSNSETGLGPIEHINSVGHSLLAKTIDTPYMPLNHLPKNATEEEAALYGEGGRCHSLSFEA